jgi:hypothetical protein
VNGDAQYGAGLTGGSGNAIVANTFGYDYVLDVDFMTLTYNIVKLTNASTTTVYYSQNQGSNPWKYNYNKNDQIIGSGTIGYLANQSDSAVGFQGGWHNVATVDLSFLANLGFSSFTAHFTMACGNDDLIGKGVVATPEPGTLLLLGTGLLGALAFGRKVRK